MKVAVIDVGSNSVLLSVLNGGEPVLETSAVTGLGTGTLETGVLSPEGMATTLSALRRAFSEARAAGVEAPRAAATMAVRLAANADEFLRRAQDQGTPVEVLSGEQEAQLGFLAVAEDPTFSSADRLSIVDVGGQSTELVTGRRDPATPGGWDVLFRRSYTVGALGLRGGELCEESPPPAKIVAGAARIDDAIGVAGLPGGCGTVVTLGATGTNLVTIRERMEVWDPDRVHGAALQYEEVSRAAGWLCSMTDAGRAAVPGMERGRETTMHIGALILERFLFALRAEACRVSVKGWRHALARHSAPGA